MRKRLNSLQKVWRLHHPNQHLPWRHLCWSKPHTFHYKINIETHTKLTINYFFLILRLSKFNYQKYVQWVKWNVKITEVLIFFQVPNGREEPIVLWVRYSLNYQKLKGLIPMVMPALMKYLFLRFFDQYS